MTDRDALLAAVCDRPDEDTPRLVFADWCDDHGDPDYARFIRAQLDLARVPGWDRLWVRTRYHELGLLTGFSYRDRYPLLPAESGYPPPPHLAFFRRGFPWHAVYPSPAQFADRAAEIFAIAPFQSVSIQSFIPRLPPDLTPLTTDRRMTRLRRVWFFRSCLGSEEIRRLADSPHLSGVTELAFECEAIAPGGMAELFRSGLPGRLTKLRLRSNEPVGADLLRGYDGPSSLRSLTLSDSALVNLYTDQLLAAPLFRGLIELGLSGNRLGPAGVAALASSPAATTLESLTLWQTAPGVLGVRALAGSPALANLRVLSLRCCDLGPVATKALARGPHLRNLAVLDLLGNAIGDKGAFALAESPHLRNLALLDLTGGELTDRGVAALLDSPVTENLEWLQISGNLSVETYARIRERFG
ncbi:MAG TPA: TIGR02996 domain-containing protein [Urbifossiella sp.]|nr:TIGR02996 domain-containing protein [Urbifossiella sp.]